MSRPDADEALQPDERLRAALRHAPDAQREPPAAVTAHILSTARAAAARPSSAPAASPAAVKRRPAWGLGSWVLARPGFALGLVALAGAAALWGLQRPGETRPVLPDPSVAQAPSADAAPAPLVVAQAEVAQVEVAAPAAPAAMQAAPAPAAPPRRSAALRKAEPHERAEMHAAAPEILVMSPVPPPPAAEFKPAPPPPAAAPAVARAEQVVVTGSAARASQAPAAVSADSVEREPPANPARAWLAALPADEAAQRTWLLALADATEGLWQDGLPLIAQPETRAALTDTQRERSSLSQALAASAAPAEERWAALQIAGRRAILRAVPQGLLWCEAGRCRYAPLSPQTLQRLREQQPAQMSTQMSTQAPAQQPTQTPAPALQEASQVPQKTSQQTPPPAP